MSASTLRRPLVSRSLLPSLAKRLASTSTLNTGARIPLLGFGTWQDKEHMEEATLHALKTGYRHIDGARVYGTEAAVGSAMRTSGVSRDDVFLTTKLWNNSHAPESVRKACLASLEDLKTDYLDLYLMHWPCAFRDGEAMRPTDAHGEVVPGGTGYVETWKAMEELVAEGKVRAIGVSNFSRAELEDLMRQAVVPPAAHQIELHPYLQQKAFCQWHAEQGVHVTQYSPFGNQNPIYGSGGKDSSSSSDSKLIDEPELAEVGKKYGKTGAQVALAWGIAHGRSVIPKSKRPDKVEENFGGDFELEAADVARVDALDRRRRFNDPSLSFKWTFYSDLEGKDPEKVLP